MSSRLWPPAAAISSARRASGWPRRPPGRARTLPARRRPHRAASTARPSPDRAGPSRRDRACRRRRSPCSGTMAASAAFAVGRSTRRRPARRAATATGSTPRVGWMPPSSDSSPTTSAVVEAARRARRRRAASTPSAIGRSKPAPTLRTSAGDRFTVIRVRGNSKPELRIAVRTRSPLSRTLASGRPTSVRPGKPFETSTSAKTSTASRPKSAAVRMRASTPASPASPGTHRPDARSLRHSLVASGRRSETARKLRGVPHPEIARAAIGRPRRLCCGAPRP